MALSPHSPDGLEIAATCKVAELDHLVGRLNGKRRRFSRNAAGPFLLLLRSGTRRQWAEIS